MAIQVNIHEAKTQLSRLLERVQDGEEIIIAKAGKPLARLIAVIERPARRIPGSAQGQIKMSDDFDEPLPQERLAEFEQ